MKRLSVALRDRGYEIEIGSGLLGGVGERLRALLPCAERLLIISDSNVYPLYGEDLLQALEEAGFCARAHIIAAGESSKCMAELMRVYETATSFSMTRSDAIIALGGGVVGDLAGYAAASLYRGIDYVHLPTTLLAQVDSSIGGKTAINLPSGKNLVGAFWQPRAVYMDTDCLSSLNDDSFSSGMAEVIKYGCIKDAALYAFLEGCAGRAGLMSALESVLHRCCEIKIRLVEADETDGGVRMLLNFGHTLGHAYELAGHYERYTHGQAVAAGMCKAAELGERLGITRPGTAQRLKRSVRAFGLPECIACSAEDYARAIGLDKKASGSEISLILLRDIGSAQIVKLKRTQVLQLLMA